MPARAARDPSIPNFLERALIRTGFLAEIIPERATSIPAFLARAPIQTGVLVQIPAKGTTIPTFLERALIRTGLLVEILERATSIPAFLSSALIQIGLLAQIPERAATSIMAFLDHSPDGREKAWIMVLRTTTPKKRIPNFGRLYMGPWQNGVRG